MNSFESSDLSLKYERCTPSGCIDVGIRKFEFEEKTPLDKLCLVNLEEWERMRR